MGYAIRLVSHDHKFHSSKTTPVIVNEFNINSVEHREALNQMIFTHYEGDQLNVLPSCECGHLQSSFNVDMKCPVCGTIVMAVTERPLESVLWIESPKGVGPFINPVFWIMASKALTYNQVNLLEYLVNPTMVITGNVHKMVHKLQNLIGPNERGINYFHQNFDRIMAMLAKENILKGKKEDILEVIRLYRDAIFSRYLPMPSKLGIITEKTAVNSYVDSTVLLAINALRTISSAVNSPQPLSLKVLQARAMQANAMMAEYHLTQFHMALGKKEGWLRSHVLGSRLHWTFRAVISSISERHDYDELHLPWSVAIMTFKLHLIGKLMRRGFTPNECTQRLHEYMLRYDPLIAELFQELIDESPYGGIPTLFSRNPTLQRGSMQLFRITKIKEDPNINSVSMSVLCLKAPNADFDGDALNGILVLDDLTYQAFQRLAPHLGLLDTKKPRSLSNNGIIPAPVATTIAAWIDEED